MKSAKPKSKPVASPKSPAAPRRPGSGRRLRRPFVAVTFATTLDGRITTKTFSPVDFTSREDKIHLLRQRSLGDAVLLGHNTLRKDNVRLGLPDPKMRAARLKRGQAEYPLRVIVSNAGRIDPDLNVFQTEISPIVIFSTTRMPRKTQLALREKATLHLSSEGAVDLAWMLHVLWSDYHVRHVACEGGASLFRAMLELGLVDQLNLTLAPLLFGGNAPTLTGLSKDFLPASIKCSLTEMRTVGEECFLTYRIKRKRA